MYGSVRYLFMMTTELIHKSFAILKRLITYVLEGIITSLILRVKINDFKTLKVYYYYVLF